MATLIKCDACGTAEETSGPVTWGEFQAWRKGARV